MPKARCGSWCAIGIASSPGRLMRSSGARPSGCSARPYGPPEPTPIRGPPASRAGPTAPRFILNLRTRRPGLERTHRDRLDDIRDRPRDQHGGRVPLSHTLAWSAISSESGCRFPSWRWIFLHRSPRSGDRRHRPFLAGRHRGREPRLLFHRAPRQTAAAGCIEPGMRAAFSLHHAIPGPHSPFSC